MCVLDWALAHVCITCVVIWILLFT